MSSYYNVFGVDTGVHSTANSAEVRANVRLRLAVGGEAGIMVEEAVSPEVMPRFVTIYFSAGDLSTLIRHLQAMQAEYESRRLSGA